jgi:hypothetical protein
METASHRDQTKSTERLVDVERAALSESHVGGEAFRCFLRNGQHLRLGIHAYDLVGEVAESDGELTRSAAEVEDAVVLSQTDSQRDRKRF